MDDFKSLETAADRYSVPLDAMLDQIPFNDQGLIPAIAQDCNTKDVLMLGWMDREAIRRTLTDGFATYYSRSRAQYWRKGETSGHTQTLRELRLDCDGDTILLQVEQQGPACHTHRANCFYLKVDGDQLVVSPT